MVALLVLLAPCLGGCVSGDRYTASADMPQHNLPLYVMEVFHARLKETCERNWVGCEFQGGLTATPQFRLEVPDTLWYWEIYQYTFARADPGIKEEEYSEVQRVRKRGIKLAAVVNLDDPGDNSCTPLTLRIAGRPLTLYVSDLNYVMPPHPLRATSLSIRDLLDMLDDSRWSLKTYSERLAEKMAREREAQEKKGVVK